MYFGKKSITELRKIKYPEKIENNFGDNDQKFVLDKLKNLFEDKLQLKTGQNIKYDFMIFKKYGIDGYIL